MSIDRCCKRREHQGLKTLISRLLQLCVFILSVAMSGNAQAHAPGESYVWLSVDQSLISGRVEINLDDLRNKLNIAIPSEANQQLQAITDSRSQVLEYIEKHFQLEANGSQIPITYTTVGLLETEREGDYAQYFYTTPAGSSTDIITITNSLFVADDFLHRSLVCIEKNERILEQPSDWFVAMVFASHNSVQELDLTNAESLLRPREFILQGVLHIVPLGADHILFIAALLLPAVLVLKVNAWTPVQNFRPAFLNIVRIVTIFTIAHSITLSLAALGWVRLPSWIVESVIALSIVLVALNTIKPVVKETWLIIFGFGLFHGIGFASVMSDLPFRMLNLVKVLIGFNIGVELGQLAVVLAIFPVIFVLRQQKFYVPIIVHGGSAVIAAIAGFWFIERAFLG
ncbi:MAG: HupE/UreJ family protein [Fuerstiella sp.]